VILSARDYYRAAEYLLSEYGEDAGPRAAARAAQLAGDGPPLVHEIWRLLAVIVREIEQQSAR
jgi:hypothetical protein